MQKRIAYQGTSDGEHGSAYAVPSDNTTNLPLGGACGKLITMKTEWIVQWDGFLYKTHTLGILGSGSFLVVAWTPRFYGCH